MSVPTKLPQYRSAMNTVAKLFAKDELPATLQKHRQPWRAFSEGFQTNGKDWIASMTAKATPATTTKKTAPTKAKTRTAGGGAAA